MGKQLRFLLSVLAFVLCMMLVACGGESDTSTSYESTSPITSTTAGETSTENTTPASTAPTTEAPEMILSSEGVVPVDAYIAVPSASYISGNLLYIDKNNPYQYNLPSLIPNNLITAGMQTIRAQNLMVLYGNKSQDYVLSSSSIFIKADAFPYWEALAKEFREQTGKTSLQVVNGYLYNSEESLNNSFITGYSIAVNLYEENGTFSLADKSQSVIVNGETMTCLSWFLDHCAQYGFVYTGLTGDETRALATFRFVGVAHALTMKFYDVIDMEVYSNFIKKTDPPVKIKDEVNDVEWTIKYFPANTKGSTTIIPLPIGAVYTVSGNNIDGFIVAYYVPGGFETGV